MFMSISLKAVLLVGSALPIVSLTGSKFPESWANGSKCANCTLFLSTRRLQGGYNSTLRPPKMRNVAHIAPPRPCQSGKPYTQRQSKKKNIPTISHASPNRSTPSQNEPCGSATLRIRLRNCTVPMIVATMTVMTVRTML